MRELLLGSYEQLCAPAKNGSLSIPVIITWLYLVFLKTVTFGNRCDWVPGSAASSGPEALQVDRRVNRNAFKSKRRSDVDDFDLGMTLEGRLVGFARPGADGLSQHSRA